MRRFLPIILIAFAALFILPQLFKHSSSKTLSSKERSQMTRDAMLRIDKAQKAAFAGGGRYTDSLAQLAGKDKVLASELTVPLVVDLSIGAGGKSYLVTVSSDVLSVARARNGAKVVSSNCRVLKSGTGYDCPVPQKPGTTTSSDT
jgi:hypothetical protein